MAQNVVNADTVLLRVGGIEVGAQRNATLTINAETLDATAKQDGWQEFLPGKKNWTVDCDALIVVGDTSRSALENALINGETVNVEINITDGTTTTTYSGSGYITSMQLTFSMGDVATYSISIQGSGALSIA